MRRAHECLLLLGSVLLALSTFLYSAFFAILGLPCLLLSWLCGMAYLRQRSATGSVGLRSHLSYFVVAAWLASIFAPVFQVLCFPTLTSDKPTSFLSWVLLDLCCGLYFPIFDFYKRLQPFDPHISQAVTLALLCGMYVIPFALLQWTDERRWLRLRPAWLLLVAAVLLPVVIWARQPTALVGAALAERGLVVRLLLYLGHDVNQRDKDGDTVLAITAGQGHVAMLELLYAAGAQIDSNALLHAVGTEQWGSVDWLLAHGATVTGSGVLEAVVQKYGNDTMVRRLLSYTPTPDQSAGLAKSADRGNLELVKLFLAHGADPNRPDQDGMAPLHRAVVSDWTTQVERKTAIIDLLLAHGANLEARTPSGKTALTLVVEDNELAVEGKALALAEYLLEKGANVDPSDTGDRTPLATAVDVRKNLPMVKLLVEHGADLARARAVSRAASANWIEGLRYLLAQGVARPQLNSALWSEVARNNATAVRLLLAAGADACAEDEDRSPAIQQASAGVRTLVEQACPR